MEACWTMPGDLVFDRLDADFYKDEYTMHERKIKAIKKIVPFRELDSVGRLFTGPFGSNLPSHLYRDEGVPLFRVQNLKMFGLDEAGLVYLDQDTNKRLRASEVNGGDILISKAGKLGELTLVPKKFKKANITEHILALDKVFLLSW